MVTWTTTDRFADPDHSTASVATVLAAYYDQQWTPGRIVETYWPEQFWVGQRRCEKVALVCTILCSYSPEGENP